MEPDHVELQGQGDSRAAHPDNQPLTAQQGPAPDLIVTGHKRSPGGRWVSNSKYWCCLAAWILAVLIFLVILVVSVYLLHVRIKELGELTEAAEERAYLSMEDNYCDRESWSNQTTCAAGQDNCTCALFVSDFVDDPSRKSFMYRVDTDGRSCKILSYSDTGKALSMAYSFSSGLFWSGDDSKDLHVAKLSSSTCVEVTDLNLKPFHWMTARGLAVDEGRGLIFAGTFGADNAIFRAEITGANLVEILPLTGLMSGLVLDENNRMLYWVDQGENHVSRADYDGKLEEIIVPKTGARPAGLAMDKTRRVLYWILESSSEIYSVSLDNLEDVKEMAPRLDTLLGTDTVGLTLCGNHLYHLRITFSQNAADGSTLAEGHVYEFSIYTKNRRKIKHGRLHRTTALTLAPLRY